jgi:two-component system sensor histidine kinase DesK
MSRRGAPITLEAGTVEVVGTGTVPVGPADTEWLAAQRKWARGWRRTVFPGVFLVYLVQVVGATAHDSRGVAAAAGYAIVAGFAACYLIAIRALWQADALRFWALYAVLVALWVAELPFAHADASVMCVFIAVVTVARLGTRSLAPVVALTLLAVFLPSAVPSWHDSLGTSVDNGTLIAIPLTSLAMFGFFQVMRGNRALADARSELARLAAENERSRIARDLHDLLGHSLTTITVKAGLARRIAATDPARALVEIGEVEGLARSALADVRAAVANYREVTLAGELATGKELLRAAGVTADLPSAVDIVDVRHQELFGWVLREGLTNVVRHAHATSCAVLLSTSSVEIIDDGVGGVPLVGGGLAGLRQRVTAAGGRVDAGPREPNGWRLRVSLGMDGGAPA